jgi:peroxiredoxin
MSRNSTPKGTLMYSDKLLKPVTIFIASILLVIPVLALAGYPKKGAIPPPLELTHVSGQKSSLVPGAGSNVLLLAVSADFCKICKDGIPRLNDLHNRYNAQGLQLQGAIYGRTNPAWLKEYIESNKVGYPLALAKEGGIKDTVGMTVVPMYLLMNKKGEIAGFYRGYNDANMKRIEQQIKTLLTE